MAEEEIKEGLSSVTAKLQEVISSSNVNTKTLAERFTDGFRENYERLQSQANVFGNVKESFSNDIGKLGIAFAPLTTLPGVETLLTLLKSIGAKLLLTTLNAFKLQKSEAKKNQLKDRASALNTGGAVDDVDIQSPVGKSTFQKIRDSLIPFFLGIGATLKIFYKGFLAGFQLGLAKTLNIFGFKKFTKSLNASALKNLQSMGGKITAFGNRIKSFLKPLGKVGKAIQPVVKTITSLLSSVGQFGKLLGKIFFPITVLFTLYEGLKNSMSQYERYSSEGIVSQIFGGILGFLGGVTSYLIGWPLDLLKSAVTWIGDKMGFDMSALEEFSFQDMFTDLFKNIGDGVLDSIQYIRDLWNSIDLSEYFSGLVSRALSKIKTIFMKITAFPKAVASGSAAAVGAFLPGGESPRQAFNRAFNESMQGSVAKIEAEQLKGEELQTQSDATTEAARDVEFGGRDRDVKTNNVQVNNQTNNAGTKKVVATRQTVSDDFSYRLALSQ